MERLSGVERPISRPPLGTLGSRKVLESDHWAWPPDWSTAACVLAPPPVWLCGRVAVWPFLLDGETAYRICIQIPVSWSHLLFGGFVKPFDLN